MFANNYCTSGMNRHQVLCQVLKFVLFILAVTSVTACSKRYSELPAYWPIPFREYSNQSVGRFKSSYLADQIDSYYRGVNPGPIGVTSFVNLDDLYSTSSFGRMYGEQLMSELAMRGYDVVELRHSDALQFLASDGEFALSRDVRAIKRERNLGGVIVGTYVVSPQRVYVNARLLDPSSSLVLSAGSVEMDKTNEITKMLRGGAFPATLERIPVKHLGYSALPVNVMTSNEEAMSSEDGAPANPQFYSKPASRPAWPPAPRNWDAPPAGAPQIRPEPIPDAK